MTIAAVGQLCSTANMSANLAKCHTLVLKAVAAGAKVLFLPEASDYIGCSPENTISLARSVQDSVFVNGLQREAQKANLHINVGIHEPTSNGRVKNTLIWINEKGVITQRYQKVHLCDTDIKDGPTLKESASAEKGMEMPPSFETPVGRVGLSICFDLRFPEMSLALRRRNIQILTYPSAFMIPTGRSHWETLLRARAIETQSYVIAAAQVGAHNNRRSSYGHSMIVNPWGEVITELSDEYKEPQIATAEIDLDLLAEIRRETPLLRRTDIYPKI